MAKQILVHKNEFAHLLMTFKLKYDKYKLGQLHKKIKAKIIQFSTFHIVMKFFDECSIPGLDINDMH